VQLTVLLTLVPAALFFRWAVHPAIQHAVASQPALLQFVEIVLVADLSEYAVHRLFHAVPWLWRFHAVHHSSEAMDWLAASRIHLVDAVVTRALAFVPLYVLGFSTGPVYAYLVFVSFHAIFVHANVRFRFGILERILGRPSSTTGTTRRRRWTRTSRSTCRPSIACSGRTTCRSIFRRRTGSERARCRRATRPSSCGRSGGRRREGGGSVAAL